MVPDRRVVSISLLLAAGVLMIYVLLLVTKTTMAQAADSECKASIDRVDNIDEPSGPGDDTIDEPPGPGDDTIDGFDAAPSLQNCEDDSGTVDGGGAAPVTQDSEQESESGDIDQSFEIS